jgi:tetratricopeptide (TPR) repeat protein
MNSETNNIIEFPFDNHSDSFLARQPIDNLLNPQSLALKTIYSEGDTKDRKGHHSSSIVNAGFSYAKPHYSLGKAFAKKGEWDKAIGSYRQALDLDSNSAEIYHSLGDALVKNGELDEAVIIYQKATEIQPDLWEVHHNLGDIWQGQERLDEAVAAYRRAIELNPNFCWSHNNLGDVLIKQEMWEEAVEAYGRAIGLNPGFHWSHYNLADALVQLERWEDAIGAYRRAIQLKADLPLVHEKLGEVLQNQSRFYAEEAIGWYRQAIEQNPGDLELYHKALEIKPDDAELYLGLGNALARQGERDEAIVFYQMGLQVQPDHAGISKQLNSLLEKKTGLVRPIAFYLPQFHPIPENDLWWGKGFTEWTNVTKAQPLFEGHYQPHLPTDMGFYDLRIPEVREAQAELAKQYGIYGFCYYYYWFAGKRLLHRPLDEMLASKKPDFPFCICWANENWTRRWDGAEHEILIAQEHSLENNQAFAESLIEILLDERYIRINGAPFIIIYRCEILPDPLSTTQQWREVFRKKGVGEVHLCAALTFGMQDPTSFGFDSGVQFPPHGVVARELSPSQVNAQDFSGKIYDYREVVMNALSQKKPNFKKFLSAMTSWDNTARKKKAGNVFINSAPELYEIWLGYIIEKTKQMHSGDEQLVFVNAWNEWAEGAHLEPDRKYGHSYLFATQRALSGTQSWKNGLANILHFSDLYAWKCIINMLRDFPIDSAGYLQQMLDELENRFQAKERAIAAMSKLLESVTIVEVIKPDWTSEIIWNVDSLELGKHFSVRAIEISGWVLSKKGRPLTVEVISEGKVIAEIPVNLSRPDVGQAYPGYQDCDSGFSEKVALTKMSSEFELHIQAVLEDRSSVLLKVARLQLDDEKKCTLSSYSINPVNMNKLSADNWQQIISMLRCFPHESDRYLKQRLDELEALATVKERTIENMCNLLRQGSSNDFIG